MSCIPLIKYRLTIVLLASLTLVTGAGCSSGLFGGDRQRFATAKIQNVSLNNLVHPQISDTPVTLSAAKNESASFQLQVSGLPQLGDRTIYTLRLQPLNSTRDGKANIGVGNFGVWQILSMPIDVNRAGYVRHTGLSAEAHALPRALLPMQAESGRVNLSAAARDPNRPTDPKGHLGPDPTLYWVDLRIPPQTPAGEYRGVCEILASGTSQPIASVPVNLTVYDFVLPDERHLNLVGQIDWESLTRLYPDRFEAVTPRLMTRENPKYAAAIKTLDQLVMLAQAHRLQVVIPRLRPTAKWPGGRQPNVTWNDFDSVVSPWLKGDMFPDKVWLGYWPLPACDGLAEYDPQSQQQYWKEAATHFDQNDWLTRSPVVIEKATPGRATSLEPVKLSADAALVLAAHSRVRVVVPLEDDQLQLAKPGNTNLIDPRDTVRLITANPGMVFSSPMQSWPDGVLRPFRWMRTDLTALIPYVGAGGDERDVRLWAWLSFLPLPPQTSMQYGPVQFIRWIGTLPRNSKPDQPADPNELIWFYPGSWFGVDAPVPTIQLKWLRRAQQDFEYLYLAKQRGDTLNALVVARLITKPVEIQPSQAPDPVYGLMCGTADPKAWDQAIDLLAKGILLHQPGQSVDRAQDEKLGLQTIQWSSAQERPVLMGRITNWSWQGQRAAEPNITLHLGLDVYNASDTTPDENTLEWTGVPTGTGWQIQPRPSAIPALATYHVRRFFMDAMIDASNSHKLDRQPIQVTFTNGFNLSKSQVQIVLPVASTNRLEPGLAMDGSLNDWTTDDAIQDGPMVRLFNRPALQAHDLQMAANPTQIFTGWADENLYLAFKISGVSQSPIKTARNFVSYQFRRAWGEDLCQILIQPVYADNSVGPFMHIVCKPTGSSWIERKLDERLYADPWQAFEGTGLRYAAELQGPDWRGEVAIPWKVINPPDKKMPVMLRFNFTQHLQDSAESSSWAGPVDFGRDDSFTGILILRDPPRPGMMGTGRN